MHHRYWWNRKLNRAYLYLSFAYCMYMYKMTRVIPCGCGKCCFRWIKWWEKHSYTPAIRTRWLLCVTVSSVTYQSWSSQLFSYFCAAERWFKHCIKVSFYTSIGKLNSVFAVFLLSALHSELFLVSNSNFLIKLLTKFQYQNRNASLLHFYW